MRVNIILYYNYTVYIYILMFAQMYDYITACVNVTFWRCHHSGLSTSRGVLYVKKNRAIRSEPRWPAIFSAERITRQK